MGRRKQIVPKKADSTGEEQSNQASTNEDSGAVESDGGSESNDDQEVTMPILESLEPPQRQFSNSPPRQASPSPLRQAKMQQEGGSGSSSQQAAAAMDLLKNPFLLPAQLLALNPNLYAAQLAQLQAAQLLLAKQQADSELNGDLLSRKRAVEEDGPLDLGSKPKYHRASALEKTSEQQHSTSESPLDLSGCKSPELNRDINSFNPLMPPGLFSLFNQLKPPVSAPDLSNIMGFQPPKSSPTSPPRSSPWQSQWASKGAEGASVEDVFKCVWCKESYQTLEGLTTHMKEAKHNSIPYPMSSSLPLRPGPPVTSPIRPTVSTPPTPPSVSSLPRPSPPARDILKEQLPLPRKLVRGQDVWIGRADQQTRDILKCMGCGQSFRSLDLLTKHMQETQHYKKVISHDQISAWKYPETQATAKNHVNSVLTCKVCDKAFSSLKELSDHMVKANHYTGDNKPRAPITPAAAAAKERKKALPVKKLLELERARQEVIAGATGSKAANSAREIMESGKLYCERCEDRIPLDVFISHIQQCVGKPRFVPVSPVKSEPDVSKERTGVETPEKKAEGNSSILGSLEQLVKGNFHNSIPKRQSVASPPSGMAQGPLPATVGKFSIQNMFPKEPAPSPSPSNSATSKPASPASSRPSSTGHPALDKSDSPGEHTNGRSKPDDSGSAPGSPSPRGSCNGSPPLSEASKDEAAGGGGGGDDATKHEESQEAEAKQKEVAQSTKSPTNNGEKKSENPLAALQMLCDTQKKSPKPPKIPENSLPDPGSMLAFSWACNQAVSSDSVIKCPFCDTPFISKGAYRHHLSKMHFTKESSVSSGHGPTPLPPTLVRTPSPEAKEDETLQSKYHKYAQLAKQLSCNQK